MTKYLILIGNLLGVFVFYAFLEGDVVVTPKMPEEVRAGDDFIVEITIRKGSLNHYARFMQKLPPGFTAIPINTQGASFTFEENNAKFTWLSMPETEEFTISYKVHVDADVYGNFAITGKFAFVDQDFERKSIAYSEWTTILVLNDKFKEQLFQQEKSSAEAANAEDAVACSRKRAVSGNEVIVNLSVERNIHKYAKIYEIIPAGYEPIAIETKEGIFSYVGSTVKFMWNMCPEGDFLVSYKLTPKNGELVSVPELKGTFFYMDQNRKTQNKIIIDNTDPEDIRIEGTPASGTTGDAQTETGDVSDAGTEKNQTSGTTGTTSENGTRSGNNIKNTTGSQGAGSTQSQVKIEYRVQICALKTLYRNPTYFNTNSRFQIRDKITLERNNGWNKYTVGAFPQYPVARQSRDKLLQTTNAPEAFITAYNNNKRITVQEALMIQNRN